LPFTTRTAPRDRVALRSIDRERLPDFAPCRGVERDEPAVERADENLTVPRRDAAVHLAAADVHGPLVRHFGIEAPELFAGARVERKHVAPRRREIQDAVDVKRRRFLAAIQRNVGEPREAETREVALVDLCERTVVLLFVVAAVGEPLSRLGVGRDETRGVDARCIGAGRVDARGYWRLGSRLGSRLG
jgi:hypothetical protein